MKKPYRLLIIISAIILVLGSCNLPFLDGASSQSSSSQSGASSSQGGAQPQVGDRVLLNNNHQVVFVPAGEFLMGVPQDPADLSTDGDNPLHTVNLDGYWIDKYPVTHAMYRGCLSTEACDPITEPESLSAYLDPQQKDRPVGGVSQAMAQAYCTWMDMRLPSEAEWEKAARGVDGKKFPWGPEPASCNLANFEGCAGRIRNVNSLPAGMSDYEVFDMAGNTYERVEDWYGENYYHESPLANPTGPASGTVRSVRGGSFKSEPVASATRFFLEDEVTRADVGFRCVVIGEAQYAPYCEISAYIPAEPGLPPGEPPPVEPGEIPEGQAGSCEVPDPNPQINYDCSPDRIPIAIVNFDGTLDGVPDGCRVRGQTQIICSGPENSKYEVRLCTACEEAPQVLGQSFPAECSPGYMLEQFIWGPACIFEGVSPEPVDLGPGDECPPGQSLVDVGPPQPDRDDFDFGLVDLVCISDGLSDNCPTGYAYDETNGCCTATFTESAAGGGGTPPAWYYPCPLGSVYYPRIKACLTPPAGAGAPGTGCKEFNVVLRSCGPRDRPGDPEGPDGPPSCNKTCGASEDLCVASCTCVVKGSSCP